LNYKFLIITIQLKTFISKGYKPDILWHRGLGEQCLYLIRMTLKKVQHKTPPHFSSIIFLHFQEDPNELQYNKELGRQAIAK
jgi:hypothetical protein